MASKADGAARAQARLSNDK